VWLHTLVIEFDNGLAVEAVALAAHTGGEQLESLERDLACLFPDSDDFGQASQFEEFADVQSDLPS